jgi:hypothetical protein
MRGKDSKLPGSIKEWTSNTNNHLLITFMCYKHKSARFEVLTAIVLRIKVCRDVTRPIARPCQVLTGVLCAQCLVSYQIQYCNNWPSRWMKYWFGTLVLPTD